MNLTLNEILSQIQKWKIEVNSPNSDGWTKEHYRGFLKRIRAAAVDKEKVRFSSSDPGLAQDEKFGF